MPNVELVNQNVSANYKVSVYIKECARPYNRGSKGKDTGEFNNEKERIFNCVCYLQEVVNLTKTKIGTKIVSVTLRNWYTISWVSLF